MTYPTDTDTWPAPTVQPERPRRWPTIALAATTGLLVILVAVLAVGYAGTSDNLDKTKIALTVQKGETAKQTARATTAESDLTTARAATSAAESGRTVCQAAVQAGQIAVLAVNDMLSLSLEALTAASHLDVAGVQSVSDRIGPVKEAALAKVTTFRQGIDACGTP